MKKIARIFAIILIVSICCVSLFSINFAFAEENPENPENPKTEDVGSITISKDTYNSTDSLEIKPIDYYGKELYRIQNLGNFKWLIEEKNDLLSSDSNIILLENNLIFDENFIFDNTLDKSSTGLQAEFAGGNYSEENGNIIYSVKSISNFKLENQANMGLFANLNGGIIKYIALNNINYKYVETIGFLNKNRIGGLVGFVQDGNIEKCSVNGIITTDQKIATGGLVGEMVNGTISQCDTNVTINGKENIGGLIGNVIIANKINSKTKFEANTIKIENSYSFSKLTADNSLGGFIGNVSYVLGASTNTAQPEENQIAENIIINTSYYFGELTINDGFENKVYSLIGNFEDKYKINVQSKNNFANSLYEIAPTKLDVKNVKKFDETRLNDVAYFAESFDIDNTWILNSEKTYMSLQYKFDTNIFKVHFEQNPGALKHKIDILGNATSKDVKIIEDVDFTMKITSASGYHVSSIIGTKIDGSLNENLVESYDDVTCMFTLSKDVAFDYKDIFVTFDLNSYNISLVGWDMVNNTEIENSIYFKNPEEIINNRNNVVLEDGKDAENTEKENEYITNIENVLCTKNMVIHINIKNAINSDNVDYKYYELKDILLVNEALNSSVSVVNKDDKINLPSTVDYSIKITQRQLNNADLKIKFKFGPKKVLIDKLVYGKGGHFDIINKTNSMKDTENGVYYNDIVQYKFKLNSTDINNKFALFNIKIGNEKVEFEYDENEKCFISKEYKISNIEDINLVAETRKYIKVKLSVLLDGSNLELLEFGKLIFGDILEFVEGKPGLIDKNTEKEIDFNNDNVADEFIYVPAEGTIKVDYNAVTKYSYLGYFINDNRYKATPTHNIIKIEFKDIEQDANLKLNFDKKEFKVTILGEKQENGIPVEQDIEFSENVYASKFLEKRILEIPNSPIFGKNYKFIGWRLKTDEEIVDDKAYEVEVKNDVTYIAVFERIYEFDIKYLSSPNLGCLNKNKKTIYNFVIDKNDFTENKVLNFDIKCNEKYNFDITYTNNNNAFSIENNKLKIDTTKIKDFYTEINFKIMKKNFNINLNIETLGNDGIGGKITHNENDVKENTTIDINEDFEILATPFDNYKFIGWFKYNNETKKYDVKCESNLILSLKDIAKDYKYCAKFQFDRASIKHSVNVNVVNIDKTDMATCNISYSFDGTEITSDNVGEGTRFSITASPVEGYEIVGWYDNNEKLLKEGSIYVVSSLNSDLALNVKVRRIKYNINFVLPEKDGIVVGYIAVSCDGSKDQIVKKNQSLLFKYKSNLVLKYNILDKYKDSCVFSKWVFNCEPNTDKEITINDLNDRYTIKLEFNTKSDPGDIADVIYVNAKGKGGNINYNIIENGKKVQLIANPKEGESFDGWFHDGVNVSKNATFTVNNNGGDTYEARFTPKIFNVILNKNEGGNEDIIKTIEYGKSFDFEFTPNKGYKIIGIKINDKDINLHGQQLDSYKGTIEDVKESPIITVVYKKVGLTKADIITIIVCVAVALILLIITVSIIHKKRPRVDKYVVK